VHKQLAAAIVTATAVLATVAPPAAAATASLTYSPDPQWWGTNGRVTKILPVGNRVYVAGGFDYVGPSTGYGVGVDAGSGAMLAGAPLVDGTVYAAAPDGQGGWYITGNFNHVGGAFRRHAAQISATGAVTRWNPKPNGITRAIAVTPSAIFLGGDFTAVDTSAATRLAAVDRTTGTALSWWTASTDRAVRSLVSTADGLYAAGDFTTVNGAARGGLVRLGSATGAVAPAFVGRTSGSVSSLALSPDGGTLYAGGDLSGASNGSTSVGRSRLAAFATSTGGVLPWAPTADGGVRTLAVDANGTVFAGGMFASISGTPRTRLAGISADGSVTGFDPTLNGCHLKHFLKNARNNPICNPEVDSLTVANGALYVGGRFNKSAATSRHDAAAFDLATGAPTSWNPIASDRVLALAASGNAIFLGGDLTSVNGALRKGVAALDAATGALDPTFTADTDDLVLDLALSPDASRLYLGGHFTTVRGLDRKRLASVSTVDGAVDTAFKAAPNDDVLSLGVANDSLYVSGQFKRIGSVAKNHAAKLSLDTGAIDPAFVADTTGPSGRLRANGMVQTMVVAPDGSKVYMGGPFETVNGTWRRGIAVVDGHTGALLPYQLGGIQSCFSGGDWLTRLYLSPDGQRLYGGDLCPDWVYEWDAVNLSRYKAYGLNWKTRCNGGMQGALEANGHFYYGTHGGDRGNGGYCWTSPTNSTQVRQQRYFSFDSSTGVTLPDHTDLDSPMGIWSFAVVPQGLLMGGDFSFVGSSDKVHQGLVLVPGTP